MACTGTVILYFLLVTLGSDEVESLESELCLFRMNISMPMSPIRLIIKQNAMKDSNTIKDNNSLKKKRKKKSFQNKQTNKQKKKQKQANKQEDK